MENVPWVEKYIATNLEEIVLDSLNKQILHNILETSYFPNLLFYGPPGTGKTYFAKAIAKEAAVPIFIVTRSDIISSYVGESEKNLKELFETARSYAPSIIFIDEIDSIAQSRKSGADASILNFVALMSRL